MIGPETIRVGLRELRANTLRTLLTGLGMVFGVAAVIAMVSIAEGARYEALRQIEAMGTNAIRVRALELTGQELALARQQGQFGLSLDDGPALMELPFVEMVAPISVLEAPVRARENPRARTRGSTSRGSCRRRRYAPGRCGWNAANG